MDSYELLGVSPDCTLEELKHAYRARVRQAHPDLGGSEAAFIAVGDAYKHILKELTGRPSDRAGRFARTSASGRASASRPTRGVRPTDTDTREDMRRPANRGGSPRAARSPQPPDPTWDPDLVLRDGPAWVGYDGRPPDPDWQPEFVLVEQGGPEQPLSPELESTVLKSTPEREPSNRQLLSGVLIPLGVLIFAVLVLVGIVWYRTAQTTP